MQRQRVLAVSVLAQFAVAGARCRLRGRGRFRDVLLNQVGGLSPQDQRSGDHVVKTASVTSASNHDVPDAK